MLAIRYRNQTEIYKAHNGPKLDYMMTIEEIKSVILQHYHMLRNIRETQDYNNANYNKLINIIVLKLQGIHKMYLRLLLFNVQAAISDIEELMTNYPKPNTGPHVIVNTLKLYQSLLKSIELLVKVQEIREEEVEEFYKLEKGGL